jgi:hypothetical protein
VILHSIAISIGKTEKPFADGFTEEICAPKKKIPRMAETNPQHHAQITTTNSRTNPQINTTQNPDLPVAIPGIKLNGQNYELWSQIIKMFISGKDKLGLITGEIRQPALTDPTYSKWRTKNAIVKGWIINSLNPNLIGNFIKFPTAKGVWDAVAATKVVKIMI